MRNIIKSIILISLLVISIFLVGCSNNESNNVQITDDGNLDTNSDNKMNTEDLSEKEKYAKFEAKMACRLYIAGKSDDPNEVLLAMNSIKSLAEDYGYTEEELTSNTHLYKDDSEFQELAKKYTLEMCPGIVQVE